MALVGKGGVDQREYLDILTSTLFTAPVYKTYGGLIVDRKVEPAGFAAPLGHKDIRLTLAAAEDLRVAMPRSQVSLRDRFLTLLAMAATRSTGRRSASLRPRMLVKWGTMCCQHFGPPPSRPLRREAQKQQGERS